jgi:TRAP-type C4-dicarboxylate transport system substrate-binding protein
MKATTKRARAAALVAALLTLQAAGCGLGGGDKAGGSSAPTVLRLAAADDADQPDARIVRHFASRVGDLSGGSLRVRPVWDAAGQQTADYEARIARMVREGEFELGWIGARAWDRLGITHFQALQAPFLVTSHALLGRIATGSVGERMLAGLDGIGLVGLALAPDRLRYPFGVRQALASPDDFAGARVRVFPSRTTEALMRALGATPVQVSGDDVAGAVARREIDGVEAALGTNSASEGENFLTTNLALFPKVLTLFAGEHAYRRLDDDQATVIRKAAEETAAYAAAHPLSERALVRQFCASGRPVTAVAASRDDLAVLTQAAQPVYAELERDPETKALIAAIREVKRSTPSDPVAAPPPGCSHEAPATHGRVLDPSTLDGTYHWRVTSAGARAARASADRLDYDIREDVDLVGKMTLRDGKWRLGDEDPEAYSGTFEIIGDRLVFDWAGTTLTFTFERHADGGLDLEPVPPIDPGDAVVWAGGPWRRVGPPVRDIP